MDTISEDSMTLVNVDNTCRKWEVFILKYYQRHEKIRNREMKIRRAENVADQINSKILDIINRVKHKSNHQEGKFM